MNKKSVLYNIKEYAINKPDKIAIVDKYNSYTYYELDRMINAASVYFLDLGIKKGDRIGVLMNRKVDFFVVILGLMKIGAVYVPFDSDYPFSRIKYMIEAAEVCKVVCSREMIEKEKYVTDIDNCIVLSDEFTENDSSVIEPITEVDGKDNVCVIFTSGTTGVPMGIKVSYESTNGLLKCADKIGLCENDRILNFASVSFILHIVEYYFAWSIGAALVITDEVTKRELSSLSDYIDNLNVTALLIPPQVAETINAKSIRTIITAGSAISAKTARKIVENYDYVNFYASSETNFISYRKWKKGEIIPDRIPVGFSFEKRKVSVRKDGVVCLPGEKGEICLSGEGIENRYLEKSHRNKDDSYYFDPLSEEYIFKTGDIGVENIDGEIEILGRNDDQISIRGFRIEPLEIEERMIEDCGVSQAVVKLLGKNDNEFLCAYYVSDNSINEKKIKDKLSEFLPYYMIPHVYFRMNEFCRNINGKIDRSSLPNESIVLKAKGKKAENELQDELLAIYNKILGINNFGISDDFFEFGGNSLNALKCINEIRRILKFNISLNEFFENSNVEEMEKIIKSNHKIVDFMDYMGGVLDVSNEDNTYPMSDNQKNMYVLFRLDNSNLAYINTVYFNLDKNVDDNKIIDAFMKTIEKHSVLRTRFKYSDGSYWQIIDNEYINEIQHYYNIAIDELLKKIIHPFNIEKEHSVRMMIIHNFDETVVAFSFHHIVFDDASKNIFIKDFSLFFNDSEERDNIIPQYYHYSLWKRYKNNSDDINYWRKRLEKANFNSNFEILNDRQSNHRFDGNTKLININSELYEKIQDFVHANKITEYVLFAGALMILLNKYSNESNICIGSPVSGRTVSEFENTMGMFVNTLPIICDIDNSLYIKDFFIKLKKDIIEDLAHQDLQFNEIVNLAEGDRDISKNPLYDILLIFQNNKQEKLMIGDRSYKAIPFLNCYSKLDMTFNIIPEDNFYGIECEYKTFLYNEETVETILEQYINIIDKICTGKEIKISELNKKNDIYDFYKEINSTDYFYDRNDNIINKILLRCEKNPNNEVILFDDGKVSYSELCDMMKSLSGLLIANGVKKNDRIAILLERRIEMIVAMMAVIYTGATYIPIDIEFPNDRIDYILSDSNAKYVITSDKTCGSVKNLTGKQIILNIDEPIEIERYNDICYASSDDAAYIIYTSGTTGKPKGVILNNRNLFNFVLGMEQILPLDDFSSILGLTTISFDIFVLETFFALANGKKIVLVNEEAQKNIYKLKEVIEKNKVEAIQCTPSRIELLLKIDPDLASLKGVKTIMVGGDALPQKLFEKIKSVFNGRIYNMYGPTETTVWSTVKELTEAEAVTVGSPIINTQIYILDDKNDLLGRNKEGRLFIGGDGVGNGYNNRDDLTVAKFIKNPFGDGRIYDTGDIAKIDNNNDLRIVGRNDFQVKVRGYRIEIGEIENQIDTLSGVIQSVVVAVKRNEESSESSLFAFITSDKEIDSLFIRNELSKKLPNYMIPSQIIQIDHIPLTSNGKIDRKKLINEAQKFDSFNEEKNFDSDSEVEKNIFNIWKNLLGIDNISVSDSFFDIGGNSFLLIDLHEMINKVYPDVFTLTDLFEYYTIESIAGRIEESSSKNNLYDVIDMYSSDKLDLDELLSELDKL